MTRCLLPLKLDQLYADVHQRVTNFLESFLGHVAGLGGNLKLTVNLAPALETTSNLEENLALVLVQSVHNG